MKFGLKINSHEIIVIIKLHDKVATFLKNMNIDKNLFLNKLKWKSVIYQELRKKDFTPINVKTVKILINGVTQHATGKRLIAHHETIDKRPFKYVSDVEYIVKGYSIYYLIYNTG